jgi:hypothetical protein
MPRQKGFKLFDEQKKKMQAGRQKAREKAEEGMIGPSKIVAAHKPPKQEVRIIGYAKDRMDSLPYPIFVSERKTFKGEIFKSPKAARESKGGN